jgi:hypothetical protein
MQSPKCQAASIILAGAIPSNAVPLHFFLVGAIPSNAAPLLFFLAGAIRR